MTWTIRQRSKVGGLAAIVAGQGPNILLLHGVGLRAEAWNAQIDVLSRIARITAPDMPGHGESLKSVTTPDVSAFSDAALAVLEELDGPALIVGHSMGAMLALDIASRSPDRVTAVVALNGIFDRSEAAKRSVQERTRSLDGKSPINPTTTLERWFGDAPSVERQACDAWLSAMNPLAYKIAYSAFAFSQIPSPQTLGELDCPALFMTGAEEPNSTPEMSRKMAELAPQGRVQVEPGAAHMMPMTHPSSVSAEIRALCTEVFPR